MHCRNLLKCRAKLIRLRRQAGSWQRGTPAKVSSAEISILDGLLKDNTAILHLNNLTVWGHRANKADLGYVLKKFDPMSVEVRYLFTLA